MPLDPRKLLRPQPAKAGKGSGQEPGKFVNDRKVAAVIRDLANRLLEEPLELLGRTGRASEADGTVEEGRVAGERIRLTTSEAPIVSVNIGLDENGGLWVQSDATDVEDPILRIYAAETCIFTLMRRAIGDNLKWPYVLIGDTAGDTTTPASPLHVAGPIGFDYRDLAGNGSTEQYWGTYVCDAAGGAINLTLDPVANVPGRVYIVKRINSGANAVVVNPDGAETIDGAATKSLNSQYAAIGIQAGTTEWHVLWTLGTVA